MPPVLGAGLTVVEPKMEDVLNVFARILGIDLNCVKIGTIEAVDYTTMTAKIQLVNQQTMRNGTYQAIKPLEDVPLFTLQGGGYSLQFPISVGDTAIVVFGDCNIDNWFKTGGIMPSADGRLHDLSDAIAIVGLHSLAHTLVRALGGGAYLTDKTGTTQLGLADGKVTIKNAAQNLGAVLGNLVTAVNNLITVLNTLTTEGGPTTQTISPASVAALVPVTTSLNAVSVALGALLNP